MAKKIEVNATLTLPNIMLVKLSSGDNIVATVEKTETHHILKNALNCLLIPVDRGHESLVFTPLIPFFTSEEISIDNEKIIYTVKPNPILINVYLQFLFEIIESNTSTIREAWSSLNKQKDEIKKHLN